MDYLLDGQKIIEVAKNNNKSISNQVLINILKKYDYHVTKNLFVQVINSRLEVNHCVHIDLAKILGCKFTDLIPYEYPSVEVKPIFDNFKLSDKFGIPKGEKIKNQTWGNGDREENNLFANNSHNKFTKKFTESKSK